MVNIRNYAIVTAAYWSFMLTDGALRMLVLLHFHTLGYSPFQLATLFLLYEFMGMVTNLVGGWIAARFGLTLTLYWGLGLQVIALLALSALNPSRSEEHTSELQSLMRTSSAVFCLKTKKILLTQH